LNGVMNIRFPKMWRITYLAEEPLALLKGICSAKIVRYLIFYLLTHSLSWLVSYKTERRNKIFYIHYACLKTTKTCWKE
jgi:hypothetical protein